MYSSNVCLANMMLWDSPTVPSYCWVMWLCGYTTLHTPMIHSAAGSHCLSCFLFGILWGFPGGSDGKESTCNVGDLRLIPGSEKSPGEGNGNPLQYSCLGNPMDRGAWQVGVHGVAKSQTWLIQWISQEWYGRMGGQSWCKQCKQPHRFNEAEQGNWN